MFGDYKIGFVNESSFILRDVFVNMSTDFEIKFVHTTKRNLPAIEYFFLLIGNTLRQNIEFMDDYDLDRYEKMSDVGYTLDINDIKEVKKELDIIYGYFNKSNVDNVKVAIEETNCKVYILESNKDAEKEESTQEVIQMLKDKGFYVVNRYINNMEISSVQFNKKNYYIVATKKEEFDFDKIIEEQKPKFTFSCNEYIQDELKVRGLVYTYQVANYNLREDIQKEIDDNDYIPQGFVYYDVMEKFLKSKELYNIEESKSPVCIFESQNNCREDEATKSILELLDSYKYEYVVSVKGEENFNPFDKNATISIIGTPYNKKYTDTFLWHFRNSKTYEQMIKKFPKPGRWFHGHSEEYMIYETLTSREKMLAKIKEKAEKSKTQDDYLLFDWHRGECREIKGKIGRLNEIVDGSNFNIREMPILYSKSLEEMLFISPITILVLNGVTSKVAYNTVAHNPYWKSYKPDKEKQHGHTDIYLFALGCPLVDVVSLIIEYVNIFILN